MISRTYEAEFESAFSHGLGQHVTYKVKHRSSSETGVITFDLPAKDTEWIAMFMKHGANPRIVLTLHTEEEGTSCSD